MIAAAAPEAMGGAAEVISDLILTAKAWAMLQPAVTARPLVFMFTVAGEVPVEARADVVVVGAKELEALSSLGDVHHDILALSRDRVQRRRCCYGQCCCR